MAGRMWLHNRPIGHAVFDAMTHAQGGDGTTFSATTSGSTRYLIVLVTSFFGASGIPSGVTYNGISMTSLASNSNASVAGSVWGLVNPASGTNNVVVSGASLSAFTQTSAFAFHDAANGIGTPAINFTAGVNPTVTVTTATGETICAQTEDFGGSNVTANAPFSELYNNAGGVSIGTQDGSNGTVTWTGSDTSVAVAIPVK